MGSSQGKLNWTVIRQSNGGFTSPFVFALHGDLI